MSLDYVPGDHWQTANPEAGIATSSARREWNAGTGRCPECKRAGCRGQCLCACEACQRGLKERIEGEAIPLCDVIRVMREPPSARLEAQRQAARARAEETTPPWAECVAQVERLGCPHETTRWARKPNPTDAMQGAKAWWAQRATRPVLVMLGESGVGKSVCAAYALAKFAELRPWWRDRATGSPARPAMWVSCPEVGRLALLREADEGLLRDATAAQMLVLDDLEADGAAAGMRALGSLIASRLDNGRLTVITGNLPPNGARKAYGNHVADRLRAMAYAKAPTGPSLRKGAS